MECFLKGGKLTRIRKSFDGTDFGTVGLNSKQEAASDRGAVDNHGARTANAVLTSDVRTGQS